MKSRWQAAFLALLAPAMTGQEAGDGLAGVGRMVPLGFESRNVVIPSFKDGKPAFELGAETLTRIDDERLVCGPTRVEVFGESPPFNVQVRLTSAVFHLGERVLRSGERSRITRADFIVEGDSLVFDTATSIGALKGRVTTQIFDTAALTGEPASGKAATRPAAKD
jgi:hypothetical protein